jgi:hypothetical protein
MYWVGWDEIKLLKTLNSVIPISKFLPIAIGIRYWNWVIRCGIPELAKRTAFEMPPMAVGKCIGKFFKAIASKYL